MRFSALFVLASLAVTSFGATVADIEADLVSVKEQYSELQHSLDMYYENNGGLSYAQTIHDLSVTLIKRIDKAAADIQGTASKFNNDDAVDILNHLSDLELPVDSAVQDFINNHDGLVGPPRGIVGAVKSDLSGMKSSTDEMYSRFIAAAPSQVYVDDARNNKEKVDALFDKAIKAYTT